MNTTLANDASLWAVFSCRQRCVFRTTGDVSNTYESMLDRALTNNNATQIVSGARGAWNDADMLEVTTHNLVVFSFGLGDDGDKPPTVTAICKTDGIGKLCTFFTDRWSRFKKVVVVSFFLLCCAIMLGYRATTDSIEAERYLALIVAICFLVVALFFLIVKQKRPEKPEDEKVSQADTDLAFKMGMDLTVKEGSVVMVIGSVGSGKSSLIQAILGEMDKVSGEVVWAQNSRVSRAIIAGIWVAFFQRVPAIIVRTGQLLHAAGVADECDTEGEYHVHK